MPDPRSLRRLVTRLGHGLLGRQTVAAGHEAEQASLSPEPRPAGEVSADERQEPPAAAPKTEPLTTSLTQREAAEEPPGEPERAAPSPTPIRAPGKERERPPLRPVPAPAPEPPPGPTSPPAATRPGPASGVVDLRRRATAQPRRWNLWDLERLARDELQFDPQRLQELSYLFVHLRQFANPDGSLPMEFDPLVRESLGDLLEQRG